MTVLQIPTDAAWHWHVVSNVFRTLDQLASPAWAALALAPGFAVRLERRLAGSLRRRWMAVALVFASWLADGLFAIHCDAPGACAPGEVIGARPTRRVLLDVDLLRTLPESWARQTMAHEAHHALVDDNARALPVLAALAFAAAWLALRGTALLVERFRNHLGFSEVASAGALPLAALLLGVAWFALQPPLNLWRQHVELEADRFALQTTCDAPAQAAMLAHFAAEPGRLPQPSLYYRLFRDDHPSDAERIGLADGFDVAGCVARHAAKAPL